MALGRPASSEDDLSDDSDVSFAENKEDQFSCGAQDVDQPQDAGQDQNHHNGDRQHGSWRDPSMAAVETMLSKFAKMMLEGIGHRRTTQTGCNFFLDCLHDTLLQFAAPVIRDLMPRDWRTLKKMTDYSEPPHWYEHFCPKNHHRFDKDNPDDENCPKCKANTRYKPGPHRYPAQPALYYHVEGWFRKMYDMPEVAQHLRGWRTRLTPKRGRLDTAFEGDILSGRTAVDIFAGSEENDDVMPMAVCADATVVKVMSKQSLTPIVCDILALPYYMRKTFTGKLLWAVLPVGAKASELFTRPMLEDAAQFKVGTAGMDFGDFRVFLMLVWLISDTRGHAPMLNCCEIGSIFGACQNCAVVGSTLQDLGSRYYISSIRGTPQHSPQRLAFKTWYEALPSIASLADYPDLPRKRNHRQLMASARRAMAIKARPTIRGTGTQNKQDLAKEVMKGTNPFTALFGLDVCLQNVTDLAHAIANTVGAMETLYNPRSPLQYLRASNWLLFCIYFASILHLFCVYFASKSNCI